MADAGGGSYHRHKLSHHRDGLGRRGGGRQLERHVEIPVVFGGNKAGGFVLKHEQGADADAYEQNDNIP